MKGYGANSVHIILSILPRQLPDIGLAIGIHFETLNSYPHGVDVP